MSSEKQPFMQRMKQTFFGSKKRAFLSGVFMIMLMPNPAVAFTDGSPIIMQAIFMYLKQVFIKKIQDTAERQTTRAINDSIKRHTKDIERSFMPSLFCDDDVKQVEAGTQANRKEQTLQAGKANSVRNGSFRGAYTYDRNGIAQGVPAAYPGRLAAKHVQAVTASAKSNSNCKPLDGLPVDKGDAGACSSEDAAIRAQTAVGVDVMPPLTESQAQTEAGAIYEAIRAKQEFQRNVAQMAIADVDQPTRQAMINSLRNLSAKPSLEELEAQSASGGADRDAIVLMQVQNRMLMEQLVETLEIKRLLAMQVANDADDMNERLAALRARVQSGR